MELPPPPHTTTSSPKQFSWMGLVAGFLSAGILFSLTSCTTGQKALEQGNFFTAVSQASDRLDRAPKNKKAIGALVEAYPEALNQGLAKIAGARNTNHEFRWETIVREYQRLNEMARQIQGSEGARLQVPDAKEYSSELAYAEEMAANARVAAGDRAFARNTKSSARDAWRNYKKAQGYVSRSDIASKMDRALARGTVHVEIASLPGACHGHSASNFDNLLLYHLRQSKASPFVRYYLSQEARNKGKTPEHSITLSNLAFSPGRIVVSRDSCKYSKDDVVIGKTKANPPEEIMGTVCSTVTTYHKSIEAGGSMNVTIKDGSGKCLRSREVCADYDWCHKWATYCGDERAIPCDVEKLIDLYEQSPPCERDVFGIVAEKLVKQACSVINSQYRNL